MLLTHEFQGEKHPSLAEPSVVARTTATNGYSGLASGISSHFPEILSLIVYNKTVSGDYSIGQEEPTIDRRTLEKMIQASAEYWADGLPFTEELQKDVFIAALQTKLSEKLQGAEQLKRWWRVHIVCDPPRKWVDQPLQDAAAAAGFDKDIFLLRATATMTISNSGVQVADGASGEYRSLFSVEQK
jgi:hypothetical protein